MMDELLLQTVVEKLEDIELLVKQNNQNKTGEELKKISEELNNFSSRTISSEKMKELIKSLDAPSNKLNTPVQNTVEHRHYLHKGIWIAIALFVLTIFVLTGWINSYYNTKPLRANDLKYRALKTMQDESLKKVLYNIDSLYKINPEYFEKKVAEKEQSFSKKAETIHNAFQKRKILK